MVNARIGTMLTTLVLASGFAIATASGAGAQDANQASPRLQNPLSVSVPATPAIAVGSGTPEANPSSPDLKDSLPAAAPIAPAVTAVVTPKAPAKEPYYRRRMNRLIALRMAKDDWFDRVALADPHLVADVCAYEDAAAILAAHKHIATIADADHFLCRRLTRYRKATDVLIRNAHAEHVMALDPQGIYFAIERDNQVANILARNMQFQAMIIENPDLGRVIAANMH